MREKVTDLTSRAVPLKHSIWLKLVLLTAFLVVLSVSATAIVLIGMAASEQPAPEAVPAILHLLGRSAAFILVIIAAVMCLAALFIRLLTRPLAALMRGFRNAVMGSAEYRIPVRSGDELGIISRSFNEMVEELSGRVRVLEESERKCRVVMESVKDIIFSLDGQGRFVFLNRRAETVLGYALQEMIGKAFADFVSLSEMPESTAAFFAGKAAERRPLFPVEVPFLAKSGDEVPLEIEAVLIREPGGESGIHGVARDISERTSMQEKLRKTERLSALGEIVSGVAHELRNAVLAITASIQALRTRREADDDKDLDRVLEEALRAQRVVHNLLDFSVDRSTSFHPCSPNVLLEEALGLCRGAIRNAEIATRKDLDPNLPDVLANAEQLRQVFLNVISNAIEAMRGIGVEAAPTGLHGSVERAWENIKEAFAPRSPVPAARGRLTVSTSLRNGMTVCTVRDTGPGIPKKLLPRIFDPFFTTKHKGEGTGLGLAVSLGIVKTHGGDMEAVNAEGGGASVSVILPALAVEESRRYPEMPEEPNLEGKRILVVEDEDSIRDFICNFLQGYGCTVDSARDVREAIAVLTDKEPLDLVISDFRMPDIDGQGLYEWIASHKEALLSRIIYITGDGLNPLTRAFLARTGVPYMLKPVAALSLIQTVWPMLFGASPKARLDD